MARSSVCVAGTLDPAKVPNKIVVCDRGVNTRVEKSDEVDRAGGIGMVLVNLSENSRDADTHAVPTVHLNVPRSLTVRAYALTAGANATLKRGNLTTTPIAYPQIGGFSSRGPSTGNGADLLKPDIAAPGVAILAAVSPDTADGRLFDFSSGTSMSAPHIAGAAALYFGKKPRWSPMAVKSAMMTTTARLKNADGSLNRDYYAQGAGNARPSAMFNPGLIFDSGESDWLSFLEGYGLDYGPEVEPVDPSNYNSPSIAIGRLAGTETVTRKVTAVKTGLYKTNVSVDGVDATVTPSLLTFTRVGQTKTIKVTLTRRSAPLRTVAFGSLVLESTGVTVRVPIAVTPQAVDAPTVVRGTGTSGSLNYSLRPGFSGPFPVTARGLAAATVAAGRGHRQRPGCVRRIQHQRAGRHPGGPVRQHFRQRQRRHRHGRLRAEWGTGGDRPTARPGRRASPCSTRAAGLYQVVVYPFDDPTGQSSTTYEYRAFAVGPDLPNLSVTPSSPTVVEGVPRTLTVAWTGLTPGTPYLGYLEYPDGTGTMVEID